MLTLAPLVSIAQGWKVSESVDPMTDPLNGAKPVIAEAGFFSSSAKVPLAMRILLAG
jgi:hypothetical protein